MLVLSRKIGQSIHIADSVIIIEVLEIQNCNTVRLGITAPKDIIVHRNEIQEKINNQNQKEE